MKHFVIGLGIDAYHVVILAHVAAKLFSEVIGAPLSYCVYISRFVIGAYPRASVCGFGEIA